MRRRAPIRTTSSGSARANGAETAVLPQNTGHAKNVHGAELLRLAPSAAILRLAIPTLWVMVAAALSNVLYTYYVSRLGPEALAAVSLVFPVTLIAITAVGGGLGAGTASAIARALGHGDERTVSAVARTALVFGVLLGLAFAAVLFVGAPWLFSLMGGRAEVLQQAVMFARVLFGGAAISFTAATLDNIFRAAGDARTPAAWATISLFLQVVLTPVFMFHLSWNLVGAAIATLLAQFVTIPPRLVFLTRATTRVRILAAHARTSKQVLREILRVGIPAALATFSNYVGLLILTGVVGRFGNAHLAAYGLGTRMDFLLLSLTYGFAVAVLTLVGMAVGARRLDAIRRYTRRAAAYVAVALALPGALLFLQPDLWLKRFTDDPEILLAGRHYFRWIAPTYPFIGISMVFAFAFQGTGRAALPLIWTVLRVGLVTTAAIVAVTVLRTPEWAVFSCVAIGNIISAAVLAWLFGRHLRRLKARFQATASAQTFQAS
jgi:putative MATE family efflux protein